MTTFALTSMGLYLSTIRPVWVLEGFILFLFSILRWIIYSFSSCVVSNPGVSLSIDSYSAPNFTPLTECCQSGFGQIRIRYPTFFRNSEHTVKRYLPFESSKNRVDQLHTSSSKIWKSCCSPIMTFFSSVKTYFVRHLLVGDVGIPCHAHQFCPTHSVFKLSDDLAPFSPSLVNSSMVLQYSSYMTSRFSCSFT